ncbi:MAG: 3-isopropylmalate dehydrogenase [Bacteroidota bacterium]
MEKKIAILAGDGIGPEVIAQGKKALDAVAARFNHKFTYHPADVGAIAIDKFGDPLPEATLKTCIESDAILFGAIGDPKYDDDPNAKIRPEQGLLRLRKSLGLYCNIRPVATHPNLLHLSPLRAENVDGVDLVIYRELTSGIYFGEKGTSEDGMTAFDKCEYHVMEIERIAHRAFKAAMNRRKKVMLVDKANVLESSRLWRRTVKEIWKQYPEVEADAMFVDNAAMQMIIYPKQFDVILTSNMFGDIISDEASVLTGSLGMLPSSSLGEKTSLFEPIHGSFPQAAGKDIANPIGTILSVALLLENFELYQEARTVRNAVRFCLTKGIGTPDLNPNIKYTCSQMGDIISAWIEDERLNQANISNSVSTII